MSVKMRQEIERKIIKAFVTQAIEAGYNITVDDGEEYPLRNSTSVSEIMKAIMTTDEDRLWIDAKLTHSYLENLKEDVYYVNSALGWVYLVYGNDGWDVIADYTTNLEHLMTEADKISEHYSN